MVDTRQAAEFGRGAVPGTINIPLNRAFTTWAGSLLPYDRDFYLITDDGGVRMLDELARDLSGIGLDRIAGHFGAETVERWRSLKGELQSTPTVSLAEVADRLRGNGAILLDVRNEGEWKSGHVPGALNIPVGTPEPVAAGNSTRAFRHRALPEREPGSDRGQPAPGRRFRAT